MRAVGTAAEVGLMDAAADGLAGGVRVGDTTDPPQAAMIRAMVAASAAVRVMIHSHEAVRGYGPIGSGTGIPRDGRAFKLRGGSSSHLTASCQSSTVRDDSIL